MAEENALGVEEQKPEGYLIVTNISKKQNVGTIVRSASAFGFKEVIVVGSPKINLFGSHGSDKHIPFRHFGSLSEARAFLHERGVSICGVEIVDTAERIDRHPFRGSTAIMLGNEGTGMTNRQMEACDHFLYIPQHGGGTASLNVAVAGSIAMHHFAIWAGFEERERQGFKYVVDQLEVKTAETPRTEEEKQISVERRERHEKDSLMETLGDYEGLDSLEGLED